MDHSSAVRPHSSTSWRDHVPPLDVQVRFADDHVVVAVAGDVDMSSWDALAALRAQLAGRGWDVVVDAAAVTFLDCEGLRALLSVVPPGRRVRIWRPSRCARLLLDAAVRADLLTEHPATASTAGPMTRYERRRRLGGPSWWAGAAAPGPSRLDRRGGLLPHLP